MTDNKRPLKVFLCHAHADSKAGYALYYRLAKDGVDAWLDNEKLIPGQDWELEIRKAIRDADLVIVCLSKQFNQAGFRQKEVKFALDTAMEKPDGEIFIVPARLEECDTLESLRRWHWVDLFEKDGYEKLTRTLSLRAERVGALFIKRSNTELNISQLISYPLSGEIGILNNLALTYEHAGGPSKALSYYQKALDLAQKIGDIKSQAVVLANLGSAYWKMGRFSEAKEYFEQSLSLSQKLGDKKAEASVLTNLAYTYESVGDLVSALELYEHAQLLNREIGM